MYNSELSLLAVASGAQIREEVARNGILAMPPAPAPPPPPAAIRPQFVSGAGPLLLATGAALLVFRVFPFDCMGYCPRFQPEHLFGTFPIFPELSNWDGVESNYGITAEFREEPAG
jgi:hypothetical protein